MAIMIIFILPALIVNLGALQRDVGLSGKERGIVEVESVLQEDVVLIHGGQGDPDDGRRQFPALRTLGLFDGIAHHGTHALRGACKVSYQRVLKVINGCIPMMMIPMIFHLEVIDINGF